MCALTVRSGAQTGVDRAALDVALELGLPVAGWVPRGRLAEDGVIPDWYSGLRETPTADYAERTEWNVRDADATLVLHGGTPAGGTVFTIEAALRLEKPHLSLDLAALDPGEAARRIQLWLAALGESPVLNVAGPRASQWPEAHPSAREVLLLALRPPLPSGPKP